ncbi:AzlD family protein [Acuticoccus kandeliae]|uniref:AzlD family protein n=1 Tax=Acuticoccus kandeliae TaxID=2073160 RepID=UPI000D3ECE61|nr:AzlD domain-containing protein [Acuticoccus kandeliae]
MTEDFLLVILFCGLLTFATRAGGYFALSRLSHVPPRLTAALDAVPAAVMTTLFAPAAFSGDWREAVTLAIAILISFRVGPTITVVACAAILIALRALG